MLDHEKQASQICAQIYCRMLALEIDWLDHSALQRLAEEILSCSQPEESASKKMLRQELYGLVKLMLCTQQKSAMCGIRIMGTSLWQSLLKVLISAKGEDAS